METNNYEELIITKKKGNIKRKEKSVSNTRESMLILKELIKDKDREHFVLLTLDTKLRVNGYAVVYIGTINNISISTFDLLKYPILTNSNNVILGHNHPSGDSEPSAADIETTKELIKGFKAMRIEIIDHLVMGENDYYSITTKMKYKY